MSRFRDSSPLEREFDRAVRDLKNYSILSEEYVRTLEMIIKLHKMMNEEKSSRVSPDVMASIGANLLGIFMIIKHEHLNIITSRAFGWIMKPFVRF